jgi:nicotinic acid mononucleotide adenylyltransferase
MSSSPKRGRNNENNGYVANNESSASQGKRQRLPTPNFELTQADIANYSEFVFYGLSGAPPTTAHIDIIKAISDGFSDKLIVIVPTSRNSGKESVECTKGYTTADGEDLRLALHKKMVQLTGKNNVRISMHEFNEPQAVATYDSLRILSEVVGGKPVVIIWGEDSVIDVANRRWNNAHLLLHMIHDRLLNVYYIPRESKTHGEFADKFTTTVGSIPVPEAKWYPGGPSGSQQRDVQREGKNKIWTSDESAVMLENIKSITDVIDPSTLVDADGKSSSAVRLFIRENGTALNNPDLHPEIISIIDNSNRDGKPYPYSTPNCEPPQKGGKSRKSRKSGNSRNSKRKTNRKQAHKRK